MSSGDWLTAEEATTDLFGKQKGSRSYYGAYRHTLALIQDRKLTWRLQNPEAPHRRIYLVSRESIEKYIANTTRQARRP